MRLIYMSMVAIILSFSMNAFAEKNHRVNSYRMPHNLDNSYGMIDVICVEGYMFLQGGHSNGRALVQMRHENGKFMKCPIYKIKE